MELAEKNGMFFIETSAKTADNINQLFEVCISLSALDYDRLYCHLHLLSSCDPLQDPVFIFVSLLMGFQFIWLQLKRFIECKKSPG